MNYAPEAIGVAKYTTELAGFLAGRGYSVEVIAAFPHYPGWTLRGNLGCRPTHRVENGVRVTRCPLVARSGRKIWRLVAPVTFALGAAPVVLWRALVSRPSTVLCIEPTLLAAPAALLAARLVGARAVLHVQDLEFEAALATGYLGGRNWVLAPARWFERAVRRRFDAIVTISDVMASRLQRQIAPTPVTVLRNWVHPERLAPSVSRDTMRRAFQIPPGARVVLYAGNLGAKQGLAVLIEAARRLRADPTIHFLVVGEGVMAGRVRAAAASLPNMALHPLLPAEQLGSLLHAADLHVLPQERAASDLVFPSKLGPILTTDKPLVVTADAGSELATWLGGAAFRVPPGNGALLAQMIATALAPDAVWDRRRAAGLVRSLDAEVLLPAFEQCLAAHAADRVIRHNPVLSPLSSAPGVVATA